MRIVGGQFKGQKLVAPKGNATRPTTDRTRESLFNILENRLELQGARVLDLFAGTGALGLEAMSRGAAFCLFVDEASAARGAMRENIASFDLEERTKLFRRDATRLGSIGQMAPFDLVFADPPYNKGLGERAASNLIRGEWLAQDACLVLEESKQSFPDSLKGFHLTDRRDYGDTTIGLFELG